MGNVANKNYTNNSRIWNKLFPCSNYKSAVNNPWYVSMRVKTD